VGGARGRRWMCGGEEDVRRRLGPAASGAGDGVERVAAVAWMSSGVS